MAITFKSDEPKQSIIRMSVKGLAKFMSSSASKQRKVLKDYKYPEPEGSAQAVYYRDARDFIEVYHRKGHNRAWLDERAQALRGLAMASIGTSKTRLLHNARALEQYAVHFGNKKYEILGSFKHVLKVEGVDITVIPDLHVKENGRDKIIKFEFGTTAPDEKICRIVSQVMFEATTKEGLGLKSGDVLFVDVPRNTVHKGARAGSRTWTDIEATCKNIAAMWPGI